MKDTFFLDFLQLKNLILKLIIKFKYLNQKEMFCSVIKHADNVQYKSRSHRLVTI